MTMDFPSWRSMILREIPLSLDVLDALVERYLPACAQALAFERQQITLGTIRYKLFQEGLGEMGTIQLYKTGGQNTMVVVRGPPAPALCASTNEQLEEIAAIADPDERRQARVSLMECIWAEENGLYVRRCEQQTQVVQALFDLLGRDPLGRQALAEERQPEPPEGEGQPWQRVPDIGQNREIIRLWQAGYTAAEIGKQVGKDEKTVGNRLSQLRRAYGEEIVPYRRKKAR